MGKYLDSINKKYATEAARAIAPDSIKREAQGRLDAMKAGGLMSRDGDYLQSTTPQGSRYLGNLQTAARTGRMPNSGFGGDGGGGRGDGQYSAGGNSGDGGGGFTGPFSGSSGPEKPGAVQLGPGPRPGTGSGRPGTGSGGSRPGAGMPSTDTTAGYDNPGYRGESAPPPVVYTPSSLKQNRFRR